MWIIWHFFLISIELLLTELLLLLFDTHKTLSLTSHGTQTRLPCSLIQKKKNLNTISKIIQRTNCPKSSVSNRSLILPCPVHFVTLTLLYTQQGTYKTSISFYHPKTLLKSFSPVKWTQMNNTASFTLMCHWAVVQFCSLHSMLQWGACFCKGHIILRLTAAHSDCRLESGVVIFYGFFLM